MSEAVAWLRCTLLSVAAALTLATVCHGADDLAGLVDPTAPINVSIALEDVGSTVGGGAMLPRFERYTLNSVLIRSNDRVAVVNNQRVRVGDRIGAAIVTSIDVDGVLLDIDGEPQALSLYGEPVKTLLTGENQ